MFWCTNDPDVHIHTFRERWSFIWGDFSLWVSLTHYQSYSNGRIGWFLWNFSLHHVSLIFLLLLSFYSHLHLLLSLLLFLQFTNYHIRVEATGKRVNRGVRLELEIAVNYFLYGDARVITWVKNSSEKLDNELHVKVKRCIK